MGLFNRKPKPCSYADHMRDEQEIVPECPGCREQRLAAGKTIEEWYDDDLIRM